MGLPQTTPAPINLISVTDLDGPAFNTRRQACQHLPMDTATVQPDVTPEVSKVPDPTSKSLTADRSEALLQMQKTDPFCKTISKAYQMGKHHRMKQIFSHARGLSYKQITDSGQKSLALVIPKSWKYTILVEAHDKLGHQGNNAPIVS